MRSSDRQQVATGWVVALLIASFTLGASICYRSQTAVYAKLLQLQATISASSALPSLTSIQREHSINQAQDLEMVTHSNDKVFILFASVQLCASLVALFAISVFLRQKTSIANHSQVQLRITQALVESRNLDQAAERLLFDIGTIYKFSFGALWLIDEESEDISPFKVWQSDKITNSSFLESTRQMKLKYKKGIGLPGRVWQSGTTHWITDVAQDKNYLRARSALETGIHAGVGFPVFKGSAVIGVIEFYLDRIEPVRRDLIDLLSPLGHEIGQFMERINSRDALIEEAYIATFAADVGRIVTSEVDLDTMTQRCAALPTESLGTVFAAIWILSEDGTRLILKGKSGNRGKFAKVSDIVVDAALIDELIAAEGDFFYAGQLLQKTAFNQSTAKITLLPLLAEPLLIDKKLVGVAAMVPTKKFSVKALMSLAITCKTIALGIARRQAEQRLRKSDRLFTEITENIEEMLWVTQPGGFGVKWVSPALAKMFGRTQQDLVDNPLITMEAIHPHDQSAAFAFFRYTSAQPTTIEFRQLDADNQYRWIWSRAYPSFDPSGKLAEVYGIATDITERKEGEKQVSEFYSMVSHELRTPLTSIHASLRIMEGGLAGPLTDKISRLVTIARSETDRLIRLINDILDLRKLEAGMLELKTRPVDVTELVELALGAMKGTAIVADVSLTSQVNWQGRFHVDQDRTLQMLENLLSNAIKFSPRGGVVLLSIDENGDYVRFSVHDCGAGIAEAELPKLFGKFQQLDSSDTRQQGGSGLGLAITKAIAEQHGGNVGVESIVGKGSIFWIELPLVTQGKHEISSTFAAYRPLRHKLLFIDSDVIRANQLAGQLTDFGFDLTTAHSFQQADELLKSFNPEAILADLDNSEAEGLAWIERREINALPPNITVLSSSASIINSCKNTRTIAWHAKPLSVREISGALSLALRERDQASVLVVEPDAVVRELIRHQLESLALGVVEASNGELAIAKAQLHPPSLIILDTIIWQPNAFEFVDKLKATALASTPLLIYTGQELTVQDKEHLVLGKTKYLTMTESSEQEFLATVGYLLDSWASGDARAKKPAVVPI